MTLAMPVGAAVSYGTPPVDIFTERQKELAQSLNASGRTVVAGLAIGEPTPWNLARRPVL
jgi:hypothetical protein